MKVPNIRLILICLTLAAMLACLPACAVDGSTRSQDPALATTQATTQATAPLSLPSSAPANPTAGPTATPATQLTDMPNATPAAQPTAMPTMTPAPRPTAMPTLTPVPRPSAIPTAVPTPRPTARPTAAPTRRPAPSPTPAVAGKVTLAADSRFYYMKLDAALKARITGMSYPASDPGVRIGYDDLRYISLRHVDFAGREHAGELIVNAKLAGEVMKIFHELYKARYPLASVRLVDDFGEPGDDNKSMAANNTSAFNYRRVTGTTTLSRHSLGAAIDVNPLFNPYLNDGRVSPANATPYVDRSRDFPGKIDHDDLCYRLFRQHGWSWGGDWSGDKDYQHFSKSVG